MNKINFYFQCKYFWITSIGHMMPSVYTSILLSLQLCKSIYTHILSLSLYLSLSHTHTHPLSLFSLSLSLSHTLSLYLSPWCRLFLNSNVDVIFVDEIRSDFSPNQIFVWCRQAAKCHFAFFKRTNIQLHCRTKSWNFYYDINYDTLVQKKFSNSKLVLY